MTEHATAIAIDPLDVWLERVQAQAYLVSVGEIALQDAFDRLQIDAKRDGLVDELGQDEIQRILAIVFRRCP